MSKTVNGFITWIRTFLDDVYAPKGQGGSITLDDVYPTGSIYMSVNATSPSTLFGGTWQRLEDTFLYATSGTADTGYQATDGSEDAVVVSHNHGTGHSTYNKFMTTNNNIAVGQTKRNLPSSGSNYYYVYSTTANTDTWEAPGTANSGVSGTGKNMPPYMKVYMWKRTA